MIEHPVIHAIEVRPLPATGGRSAVLTADNEGVSLIGEGMVTDGASFTLTTRKLVAGSGGRSRPSAGAARSISAGFATAASSWRRSSPGMAPRWSSGRRTKAGRLKFGTRTVLDSTLADGHALWVADVDGDGDDEVFAGHRGKDHRVSMYDFDRASGNVEPHRARPRHRRPGPARRRPRRRRHARRRGHRRLDAQRRLVQAAAAVMRS